MDRIIHPDLEPEPLVRRSDLLVALGGNLEANTKKRRVYSHDAMNRIKLYCEIPQKQTGGGTSDTPPNNFLQGAAMETIESPKGTVESFYSMAPTGSSCAPHDNTASQPPCDSPVDRNADTWQPPRKSKKRGANAIDDDDDDEQQLSKRPCSSPGLSEAVPQREYADGSAVFTLYEKFFDEDYPWRLTSPLTASTDSGTCTPMTSPE